MSPPEPLTWNWRRVRPLPPGEPTVPMSSDVQGLNTGLIDRAGRMSPGAASVAPSISTGASTAGTTSPTARPRTAPTSARGAAAAAAAGYGTAAPGNPASRPARRTAGPSPPGAPAAAGAAAAATAASPHPAAALVTATTPQDQNESRQRQPCAHRLHQITLPAALGARFDLSACSFNTYAGRSSGKITSTTGRTGWCAPSQSLVRKIPGARRPLLMFLALLNS